MSKSREIQQLGRRAQRCARAFAAWRRICAALLLAGGLGGAWSATFMLSWGALAAVEASEAAPVAGSPNRYALVIGVSRYSSSQIGSAIPSARAMAQKLESLGFEVDLAQDVTLAGMRRALASLGDRAERSDVVLFYFAGHSVLEKDRNLLLPVDAGPADAGTGIPSNRAVAMETVLEALQRARNGTAKLVVLDTAPFPAKGRTRGLKVGSASSRPHANFLIANSNGLTAQPGRADEASVFTKELVAALDAPGRPVESLFQAVKLAVNSAQAGAPEPSLTSTLTQDIYLVDPQARSRAGHQSEIGEGSQVIGRGIRVNEQEAPQARLDAAPSRGGETAQATPPSSEFETALWNVIRESKNAADFEAYLEVFPSGQFAEQARKRIAILRPRDEPKVNLAPPKIEAMQGEYIAVVAANMREHPETDASILGRAEKGARLAVTGRVVGANWYQVKTQSGGTAYIASNLLREAPAQAQAPAKPQVAVAPPRVTTAPPANGKSFRDCPECPEMVPLVAGTFRMGNDKGDISERPVHTVRISKPFALGKFEVTVAEWTACVAAKACTYTPRIKGASDKTPVHKLSWKDIQEYLAWLTKKTGKAYRLPSEAEWEYAARGGTDGRFWWGERMAVGMADCKDCGGGWQYSVPAAVDTVKPNPFGLYGMNGGVWEWTDDCWRADHDGAPTDGAASSKGDCGARVLRGGSWRNDGNYAHASSRLRYDFNVRYSTNGFRVARDLP